MNFPNEVSFSILVDPPDLGNVIGGKSSINLMDLTTLPDGFHPLRWGVVADYMMEFASARRAAREDGIDGPGWTERLDDELSGLVKALRDHGGWSPERPFDANAFPAGGGPTCKTERGPEGAAARASRPGGVNISFPALVERAQAAALATARGATTAAGNRL